MAEPTSTGPPSLTFGVELELVCRYNANEHRIFPKYALMLEPWRAFVEDKIVKAFRAGGLAMRDNTDGDIAGLMATDRWTLDDDLSIDNRDPEDPTSWGGRECEYSFLGLELKSPVLTYGDADLAQVATALDILTHRLGGGIRVLVNRSCGLHVHIGQGGDGFPLRTMQLLAGLGTAFEPTIHRLHPEHRLASKYCVPLSRGDRLRAEVEVMGRVTVVVQTETVRDFIQLVHGGSSKHWAYNFQHLMPLPARMRTFHQPFRTIEFRQHEASLDPGRVRHWIHFCAALVTYAHTEPETQWSAFVLRSGLQPTAVSVHQFLTTIRAPPATVRFLARRQNPVGLPDMPPRPPVQPPLSRTSGEGRAGIMRMRLWTDRGPRPVTPTPSPSPEPEESGVDGNRRIRSTAPPPEPRPEPESDDGGKQRASPRPRKSMPRSARRPIQAEEEQADLEMTDLDTTDAESQADEDEDEEEDEN